jgi:NADH:quinone reductase (non-electrogenic)
VKQIVVLGAGFAGLIAAVGAARKLAELDIAGDQISVTVVNRDALHAIRVRNVCDLIGEPMLPLDIGYHVTYLDLGAWGAVYTRAGTAGLP